MLNKNQINSREHIKKIDQNVLDKQLFIIHDFLIHYASYKGLRENFDSLKQDGSKAFWVYTINAHYYQAINLWSMVFGSDKEETHWKRLGIESDFTSFMLPKLGIEKEEYDSYWKSIIDWRNNYSAHKNPHRSTLPPTPSLKLAREVALLFPDWINQNSFIHVIIDFKYENYEEEFIQNDLGVALKNIISKE